MTVTVCLGSACHVRGSHQVLETLQRLIKENHVEDKVQLEGAFCMGNCEKCVCVRLDGTLFSFSPDTTEELFQKEILAKVK